MSAQGWAIYKNLWAANFLVSLKIFGAVGLVGILVGIPVGLNDEHWKYSLWLLLIMIPATIVVTSALFALPAAYEGMKEDDKKNYTPVRMF